MNRRNLLKIIPIGLLMTGGVVGLGKLFAAQKKSPEAQTVDNKAPKKMITLDELKTLERDPERITPIALSDDDWSKVLSPNQFVILRKAGTERPGSSPLDNENREGQFVCAGCGLALFESNTKFDSGTGWPSFYDVIDGHMGTSTDWKIGYPRTEYHCARCEGHQGHVFKDGPRPTGLRYCNNGLAIKFIPADSTS